MEQCDTEIDGLKIILPGQFNDGRGLYKACYNAAEFHEQGIDTAFTQTADIYSRKGVLRGLHFQRREMQAKLLHAVWGTVFDVALDLREGSPTFGKYHCELLQAEKHVSIYIPEGFAHGYLTLSDESVFSYQSSGMYSPENCGGIIWNDKDLSIPWPLAGWGIKDVICSEQDKKWPTWAEYCAPRV